MSSLVEVFREYIVPEIVWMHGTYILRELDDRMESLWRGSHVYAYKGDSKIPGNDYLKSKSFFQSRNPSDLAKTLIFWTLLGAAGVYLAPTFSFWLGYSLVVASGFFILGGIRQYYHGNHLDKALKIILGQNSYDRLPTALVTKDPIWIQFNAPVAVLKDRENVTHVAFQYRKLEKTCIKVYHIGQGFFPKPRHTIQGNIYLDCSRTLEGKDIEDLIQASANYRL